MAKPDWGELQQQFLAEHADSGVSPKEWCEAQGLNYSSARRYIKKPTAQPAQKTAQKKLRTAQIEESAEELVNGELSAKQKLFVAEYLKDSNATQAAIRAGYSKKSAYSIGEENLRKPAIAQAIANQQKASIARQLFDADEVLARMWAIATVDVNELVEHRRTCCRYCWGKNHDYQWTENEYNKARSEAEKKNKPSPELAGGFGYRPKRAAHPECPQCEGEGFGSVHIHDTTKLSPNARMAYQGVKTTKDGIEVLISNRDKMLENIAKSLGVLDSPAVKRQQELDVEKRQAEIEKLKTDGGSTVTVIHNALPLPGR